MSARTKAPPVNLGASKTKAIHRRNFQVVHEGIYISEDCHSSDNVVYRFYCGDCNEYILSDSPAALAARLNHHNMSIHPMNYSKWTETTMMGSKFYEGSSPAPSYITQYAKPNADEPLAISDGDKRTLARMHVTWE